MNLANLMTNGGTGFLGAGILVAVIEGLFHRGGRRAEAAAQLAEAAGRKADTVIADHELWREEAKEAYDNAKAECAACKKELKEAKDEHEAELSKLQREMAEIRDALNKRLDAIDEMLPYVQGMPEDKMAEIRAANRAARLAVWRG
ncbi:MULTISPECIES: hypothetical protein [unclassified Mycobacterium]|uniref:hypothetical protein n=1 Tax=unclassified Mycobacterium TaxID=2642494 RepID=UPI000800E41E|nr:MULTISPECIES: hypothetical protein [unclassified Mycobacterium]OBG71319.1 hypothetical protein A5700_12145 [Mycobacterium sp. E1214]OBH28687.1 hypothetical protein A5693_21460 [Mycobacterium sp. E1319]